MGGAVEEERGRGGRGREEGRDDGGKSEGVMEGKLRAWVEQGKHDWGEVLEGKGWGDGERREWMLGGKGGDGGGKRRSREGRRRGRGQQGRWMEHGWNMDGCADRFPYCS